MDPLPQIPSRNELNDTACLIQDAFKEKLESETFPIDVASNLKTYSVDDNLSLKETANNVLWIYRSLEEESDILRCAECDIIHQHGGYLFNKHTGEKNEFLKEMMKLKPCDIFPNICLPDKLKFGLIEKCDLYPDAARSYLDFRFNTSLHRCKRCFSQEIMMNTESKKQKDVESRKRKAEPEKVQASATPAVLVVEPNEILFKNCDLNTEYKQIFRIKNVGTTLQAVSLKRQPTFSAFSLSFKSAQKVAPGMYATGTVKFRPEYFDSLTDQASFLSRNGEIVTVPIKCSRDPPKLLGYVFKMSESHPSDLVLEPGFCDFSLRRQYAVNNTIDCGSCFATEHVVVSLVLCNRGHKAKFFLLTEEDFCHRSVKDISTSMELSTDSFWIYPTYFEMMADETSEINILFQPVDCGFQAQTVFLMCDNNTYQEIELIGDALCFNRNMVTVNIPDQTKGIESKEWHCIFLGYVSQQEKSLFTLSITNRSAIFLKYDIKIETKDDKPSMRDWLQIINHISPSLAPYSTTDAVFMSECPSDIPEGYYNAKLRLFIKDVPIASLEDGEKFRIRTNDQEVETVAANLATVDVLITEIEIACYVNPQVPLPIEQPAEEKCEPCLKVNCPCTYCKEEQPPADMEFSTHILDFGILPVGADVVQKHFYISNLSSMELKWTIVEVKYDTDIQPYMEVLKENKNLSATHGKLLPNKRRRIKYKIINKRVPARYVSVLVLFAIRDKEEKNKANKTEKDTIVAQCICIVTYEIIKLDIGITTGKGKEPILCPMQMMYTGVPADISFKIHNYSLISGCFYFLKPQGADAKKLELECRPQLGELKPCTSTKIHLKLTCYEVGILEDVLIPCFISKNQEPIQLRLLCVVDCIHVFFYLPTKNLGFQKILWPPKVVYEYDSSWSSYCLCEETPREFEESLKSIQSNQEVQIVRQSTDTLNNIQKNCDDFINENKTNDEDESQSALKTLVSRDSDIFLQDCVMEVKGIRTREPRRFTIYFENVTPKSAKYSVQSTNYSARENNIRTCLGPKYKKTEDMWEPMIGDFGIVVQPEIETGYVNAHELVSMDIWVYAKTWGIYAEEIVVDIENIAAFSFSLILEALGCPLEVPLGLGSITKYPTIRFGSVTFDSEPLTKNILIKNTSSLELTISWHVFFFNEKSDTQLPFNFICDAIEEKDNFQFNFTDRFFGVEKFGYIQVPAVTPKVKAGSQVSLPVVFNPHNLNGDEDKFPIRCFILGSIFPQEKYKLKSNYFFRKESTLVVEATAALEKPNLKVEFDNSFLQLYANDVAIGRKTVFPIKCLLRNPTMATVKAKLEAFEPISIGSKEKIIILDPGKCKEIIIPCVISYENILKWAEYVYHIKESTHQATGADESYTKIRKVDSLRPLQDKNVDEENKILTLHRKIALLFPGGYKNIVPLTIQIFYPNILVKPLHVKFGYVLLGRTQKAVLSIYNQTGYVVLFDIYKTIESQEIYITPASGEIQKSVGMNLSFINLSIFFTPTECRTYHESIRIVTNIPDYYIDIPIKGVGSFNEKFD